MSENTMTQSLPAVLGEGLIYAWVFDGVGGGRRLAASKIADWKAEDGVLWLHLDYAAADTRAWLQSGSGLDERVTDALLAEDTRPRVQAFGSGLLLALRGVNLNPGADPEDMVAVRVWADATRIVSTRRRRVMSSQQIDAALVAGDGPCTPGEFIVELSGKLVAHMQETIETADERVSEIEEELVTRADQRLRSELSELRRDSIALRRYLAPQRDAMAQLLTERMSWLGEAEHLGIRVVMDHLMRYLEDLDSIRDRAAVMHEELANNLAEQLNQRMYMLSLVAAFFLPLGFLTGLLGVNLGGIPGADSTVAFGVFAVALIAIVGLQVWLFQRKGWL